MQKFTENPVEDISAADKEEKPDGDNANPPGSEPSRRHSILRNRKGLPPRDRRESISKQVQFDEQTLLREQSRMQGKKNYFVIIPCLNSLSPCDAYMRQ